MSNADQITFWNGAVGERWVREQEMLDPGLRAFGDAAMDAAGVREGEAVVDVGCGCGATTLLLADRVKGGGGQGGRLVGLDVSAPMLARAKERSAGRSNVSFVLGDAAEHPLERGAFDLLFSRFGVMFFADPAAAFTHLRLALKGSGRISFVCWRALAENAWARIPLEATMSVVGRPEPAPPDAPGPFAFGDAARVRRILETASFVDVVTTKLDTRYRFGAGEHPSLDDAVDFALTLGPTARLLTDRDDATIALARDAIRRALAPHETPEGVHLAAACWVVTARNRT